MMKPFKQHGGAAMRGLIFLTLAAIAGCAGRGGDEAKGRATTADACGAARYQSYIGQPVASLPQPLPNPSRVACTSCPVTMDFSEKRLNVFYDQASGRIETVRCG